MSPLLIVPLSTLKGPSKAPAADPLRLYTLRGTKTTPESYEEHPCPFHMGVSFSPTQDTIMIDQGCMKTHTSKMDQRNTKAYIHDR